MKGKIKKSREKNQFFQRPKLAPAADFRVESTPLLDQVDQQICFDKLDFGKVDKQIQVNSDSISRLQLQLQRLVQEKELRWQTINKLLKAGQTEVATDNKRRISVIQPQQEEGNVQGLSFSLRKFLDGEKVSSGTLSQFELVPRELHGLEDQM